VESAPATNDIEPPPGEGVFRRYHPRTEIAAGYEHQVGRWPMIDAHQQDPGVVWDPKGRIAGALVFLVMVDDNSNYVRESEHTRGGEFQTLGTTITAYRKIVDDDLDHLSKPGMTAEELYNL
jgi:hypothetical protein